MLNGRSDVLSCFSKPPPHSSTWIANNYFLAFAALIFAQPGRHRRGEFGRRLGAYFAFPFLRAPDFFSEGFGHQRADPIRFPEFAFVLGSQQPI